MNRKQPARLPLCNIRPTDVALRLVLDHRDDALGGSIAPDSRCLAPEAGPVAVASSVRLALDPWRRLRGLLGGPPLQGDEALLLRPCNGVHTFFMRYAIDVVFIDPDGQVVAVAEQLRPWRATGIIGGARAAVELVAGAAARVRIAAGQHLAFERRC